MKSRKLFLFLVIAIPAFMLSADISSFQIYNSEGKKKDFDDLIKKAVEADVVLFGELHDNAVGHWLQYELTKSLSDKKNKAIILGAEMFESDGQIIIDEYLTGVISQSSFEKEERLWPNYKGDYKPAFEFAVKNKIPYIATNVPRRYASLVAKVGLDSLEYLLPKHSKMFLAPLPIEFDAELPGYKGMSHAGPGGGMKYLPHAQALKDATMAHFIVKNFKEGSTFIHFNGAYHSNNYEGIVWYLNKYKPGLKILTISMADQKNIDELEKDNLKLADFIIAIDEDFTKTYK